MSSDLLRLMTSHPIVARTASALLLLGVSSLQGCLTEMLWAEDFSTPPLRQVDALCRVHSIRGDFLTGRPTTDALTSHTASVAGVEVEFSVYREKHTPVDVEDFTPENPGRLLLNPPPTEDNWFALPGASIFAPRIWEFGVYRGSYFSTQDSSVPLSFVGDLRPEQIGELRKCTEVPSEWLRVSPLPPGKDLHHLLLSGLKSFKKRDWVNLVAGETGFTERDAVPLAWLDAEGQVLTGKEMHERLITSHLDSATSADLAKYTLLGRLDGAWGDPLYVRVPLAILVQGEKLRLKRIGKKVLWQRTQVWRGELQRGTSSLDAEPLDSGKTDDIAMSQMRTRPANSMPLLAHHFVYSYAEEDTNKSVLITLAKYILTPPAVLLDFAARTSVFYVDIVRWMAHGNNQKWSGPIGGDKKK